MLVADCVHCSIDLPVAEAQRCPRKRSDVPKKSSTEEDYDQGNMDLENACFRFFFKNRFCVSLIRKKNACNKFVRPKGCTQCILLSNTECVHHSCLLTRKPYRAVEYFHCLSLNSGEMSF